MSRHITDYEHNYWDNVGRGVVGNSIPVNKIGKNPAVSTTTPEDMWDTGGDFVEAVTAEVVNIRSANDIDDKVGGDGALTVGVRGVDDNFNLANEIVIMTGNTDAPTLKKYWFIHELEVLTAGVNGVNTGAITAITTAAGTPTLATILAAKNKTFMGMMMVPDNYNLVLKHWNSSVRLAAGGAGEYELQIKPDGEVFQPVEVVGVATQAGTKFKIFEPLISIAPRSIVKVRVIELSAAAMKCSSSFHGALEKIVNPDHVIAQI